MESKYVIKATLLTNDSIHDAHGDSVFLAVKKKDFFKVFPTWDKYVNPNNYFTLAGGHRMNFTTLFLPEKINYDKVRDPIQYFIEIAEEKGFTVVIKESKRRGFYESYVLEEYINYSPKTGDVWKLEYGEVGVITEIDRSHITFKITGRKTHRYIKKNRFFDSVKELKHKA